MFMRSVCRNMYIRSHYKNREEYKYFLTIRSCQSGGVRKEKSALKKEEDKFKGYILFRYTQYVKNYETLLEKRFPTAVKMYRIFSIGIKDFYRDLKSYISIRLRVKTNERITQLSLQEIELYHKMPKDMWRIAPVLLLSAIPFGNYVIFPLALMKPRLLLCSHFWSIQQKSNFVVMDLKDRIIYNKPVFRSLQANKDAIKDEQLMEKWSYILGLIGSGVHPKPEDIIACKDLFAQGPYQLGQLSYSHIASLIRVHGMHRGLFRRNRLHHQAFIIWQMDKAIQREGGVEALSNEALKNACFIRGLNASNLSNSEMVGWINQWFIISNAVSRESLSLLLHCPVLLGYNHSQNWVLIYQ